MRFIHSNKQYIERTMYPINPYMNAPAVVPFTIEAFVAPADFDADAQELNIVKAFAAYSDANKKYIFSVGTSATTVLPAVTGRSYAYSENGGSYTTIASGTVTWTVGSVKRNVVVLGIEVIDASIPLSAVWCHFSEFITTIGSEWANTSLRYLTANKNNLNILGYYAFAMCSNLTGILTLPTSITETRLYEFFGCTGLTEIIIPAEMTKIGVNSFYNCAGATKITLHDNAITDIATGAFSGCYNAIFNGSDSITLLNIGDTYNGGFNQTRIKHLNLVATNIKVFDGSEMGELLTCILPDTLETLGNYALGFCPKLETVRIPPLVTSLMTGTFINDTGLISLYSHPIIPPQCAQATFQGVSRSVILHVPVGSLAAYQAAPYWNEFTNIIADL